VKIVKEFENTKLISEDCMVKVAFEGLKGGAGNGKWLWKKVNSIKVTHNKYGNILLDKEEIVNLKKFLENILNSLNEDGILILGTPNITASKYATKRSEIQHINLKSMKTLKNLLNNYFKNVFMFGMNDEVVHTGYSEMSHYIWGMGVGLRNL
jgi:hypothetical protein